MSALKKMFLILIIIIVLAGIGWVGISVYAGFFKSPLESSAPMPEKEEAKYKVLIENTGNLLLTSKYEYKDKIYILHGFFELVGKDWKYRASDLVLDEAIFGKITIERR